MGKGNGKRQWQKGNGRKVMAQRQWQKCNGRKVMAMAKRQWQIVIAKR